MAEDLKIVALCGAKRMGKDTAANVLIENYGFHRISFADGLRKTVCTALRCDESRFQDDKLKDEIDPRTGKPWRYWLQWIGTEGFRALWDDVWIAWWKSAIEDSGHDRIVCTDMRFPNEFAAAKSMGAHTIRIFNPNIPPSGDQHASEAHQANFPVDDTIVNGGTIADLQHRTALSVRERFNILPTNDGVNLWDLK